MEAKSRKEALRYFFTKVIEPLGYKWSPDQELVEWCLDQEVELEKKYGSPFCPCQARVHRRAEDMHIVCPCIPFHRAHYDFMRRCWCGLYVHKDVKDMDEVPQIPYNDFLKAKGGG